MAQKDNILQELAELKSRLAGVAIQNIYTVPDGYFEGLPAQMLKIIKAIEAADSVEELSYLSPMLNSISKQMPFTVPQGYFEGLQEKIMDFIGEGSDNQESLEQTSKEELETLSPLLSGLKKQMSARPGHSDGPFSVPRGYFESLTEKLIPAENKPAAKVISLTHRKWFRYAAAAVIAGVIAMAGFLYTNNKTTNNPAKALVKFEKNLNKEIKKTSDKELDEFIQQFSDAGLNGEEKANNQPDSEVKELLKDVSETELKEFLEETADTETMADEPSSMN